MLRISIFYEYLGTLFVSLHVYLEYRYFPLDKRDVGGAMFTDTSK